MRYIVSICIMLSALLVNSYGTEGHESPNFFEFFGLEKSGEREIFRDGSFCIIYSPADRISGPLVYGRLDGREMNLFYFRLDESDRIVKSREIRVDASDTGHCHLLSDHSGHPVVQKLAKYFGHNLNDCMGMPFDTSQQLTHVSTIKRRVQSDSNDALPVLQGHFAVLKRNDGDGDYNGLKTFGAGPCVIVSIYDKKNHIGMLTHVDACVNFAESMHKIVQRMKTEGAEFGIKGHANEENISAHIIGGDSSSKENLRDILNVLSQYGIGELHKNILTYEIESAWLDISTGEVFKFQVNPSLESNDLPDFLGVSRMDACMDIKNSLLEEIKSK